MNKKWKPQSWYLLIACCTALHQTVFCMELHPCPPTLGLHSKCGFDTNKSGPNLSVQLRLRAVWATTAGFNIPPWANTWKDPDEELLLGIVHMHRELKVHVAFIFFFSACSLFAWISSSPTRFFLNEAGPAQPGFHSPPSVFYWHKFCLFSVVLQHLLYPPSRSPRASTPCCYQLTGREREEENKKQGEKKTGLLGKQTLVLLLGARSLNPFADSGCWKTARICWKVLQWSHVSLHNRMFQPRDESFLFVLFF